jgi:two-component system sensor histidine kinase/response regulator
MEQTPEQPTPKILIVDDNEANRLLAQATLEDEGYRVALATGGAEAIAAYEADRPDCVLLDVRMPGIDGFTACERIRALPGGAETPIIFLTALRDVDTFDKAQQSGGDDFLTKPIRPSELVIRVRTALELRRLGKELREHYGLLKKQRDDLLRLQLQKERLMAFVVHDLKNPVSSMDLVAQLLLRNKGVSADARDAVAQIRTEARNLTRMIMNLLDLSKADEGKLEPRRSRVALAALVGEVFAELEINAQLNNVLLSSSIEAEHAHADEDLLRRLLANLVENAVRHAPAGSTVTVTSAGGPDGLTLRVADAGHGVPPEMRDRIFDPFVQVEGANTRAGRGLGLTFCKLAAEAHGGTIWIEDGAPGSIFCVRLPHDA